MHLDLKTVEDITRANIRNRIWSDLYSIFSFAIIYGVFSIAVEARQLFLPCTLPTGILALVTLLHIVETIRERRNFWRHAIFKQLARYGEVPDVVLTIAKQVEAPTFINHQIFLVGRLHRRGDLYLTEDWIVVRSNVELYIMQLAELMWVYSQKHNGRGFGYIFYMKDMHGREIIVHVPHGRDAMITQLADHLRAKVPWIMIGHTPELNKKWNKDRIGFIAMVEQRRTAFSAFTTERQSVL